MSRELLGSKATIASGYVVNSQHNYTGDWSLYTQLLQKRPIKMYFI